MLGVLPDKEADALRCFENHNSSRRQTQTVRVPVASLQRV